MEQGSLKERVLDRSVLKHVKKQNSVMSAGPLIGQDYAALDMKNAGEKTRDDLQLIMTEAVAAVPYIAWTKAMNNFACSGGTPQGVRLTFLLPAEVAEQDIKRYMQKFISLAEQAGVSIMGGHTQVDSAFAKARFQVTVLGTASVFRQNIAAIQPGYDIVMTKEAGLLGTDLLARRTGKKLSARFAKSYIESAYREEPDCSIVPEAQAVCDCAGQEPVYYMHDVSCGGVYAALWQLAVRIGRGIEIEHAAIPIRQETIEICEYYGLNPYMLEGTGSLLIVARDGSALADCLAERGIPAVTVGRVAENNDKVIDINEIEKRYLTPVSGDEIYKVLSDI